MAAVAFLLIAQQRLETLLCLDQMCTVQHHPHNRRQIRRMSCR